MSMNYTVYDTTKKMYALRNKSDKRGENLHTENHNYCGEKLERASVNGENIHSWVRRLNIVMVSIFSEWIYRVNAKSIKIPAVFVGRNWLKFMWNC